MKCPPCEGSGKSFLGNCLWCQGSKNLNYKNIKRYVAQLRMLAGGGYIAGDHSYKDMREMEARADKVDREVDAAWREERWL